MTQIGDLDYLNALYAASEDPWHLRSGWYSDRKRDSILAMLPKARYQSALEVGCEIELTTGLARRCESVLGVDARRHAVSETHPRTAHLCNVSVQYLNLPHQWPEGLFDLVVLHEVGYSVSAAEWAQTCQLVSQSVSEDATVLACHWRHDLSGRTLQTETVHGMLDSMLGLNKQTHLRDTDFIIDVWTTSERSVASLEGLI